MLLKLVHKIERERMLSNTFYEVNITLIAKLDKKIQRTTKKKTRENYRPISWNNIAKDILRTYLQTEFDIILKTSHAVISENES
jgi:hypothetical protein